MSELAKRLSAVLLRDLRAVKREIEAYPTEADIWRVVPGITNTGGTLALHLAGNLQHFVGALLGGSGYVRNRDAEFSRRDVPRSEIVAELEKALSAVHAGLARVTDADLARDVPQQIGGKAIVMGDWLLHLSAHLAYHLGQIDYHRRLTTGQATTVGTMPVAELSTAR